MKYIFGFLTLILVLLGAVYALLFTTPGNDLLKPVIEKKIAAAVPVPTRLETFVLRPDRFAVVLRIGEQTRIDAKGSLDLLAQSVDATYDLDIKDLADLKQLTGQNLRGPFRTHGTIQGNMKEMAIDGTSDVAQSDTVYHLTLRHFAPDHLKANLSHLRIEKLLYMVEQPLYAEGSLTVDADLTRLDPENLKGLILTTIREGKLHPAPIRKEFQMAIPSNLTFKSDIKTRLDKTRAINRVNLVTSIASLQSKELIYDIKKGSLATDYKLHVPDLDKLYFVTNQHLKGDITVTGNVKSSPGSLEATAHADTLGGAIDATVKNNHAQVLVKNIQTVALTDMLLYPHIFDSRANAKLTYNTLSGQGKLHAELLDGQILPNKMSFLLQQMANFDITREIYERTTLETRIDKKVLHNDLHMKSRLTEIDTKNALVDLNKEYVDAVVNVKIRKTFIPVKIKGKLKDPSIKIESKALLKSKAKEELEKRLPDNIKNSPAKDLLKNFF